MQDEKEQTNKKKVETEVTCPKCGHTHQVEVEVPETTDTPKMTWEA